MPRRSFENGRQVSGDTTRIASQAFRMPRLNGASLPPVIARSVAPCAPSRNACPIAWPAEEHAVEMVKLGPVMPNSIEMWLAPALAIVFGMVSGCTRLLPLLVDLDEPDVLGALTAHAGSGDDRRRLAQFRRPLDARLLHRLARRDHRELREAVHEVRAAVVEIGLMAVVSTSAPF